MKEAFNILFNPLLWYLLLQFAGLQALHQSVSGHARTLLRFLLLLTLLLTLASIPWARKALEASLFEPPISNGEIAPAFIFVLGGGYAKGVTTDEDLLGMESVRRVLHGATLWRHYPGARLVLSGMEYNDMRKPERHAQLMAEVAMSRGVPASVILLEPRSRNTREHPVEALKLPGMTSETPIALVTNGWHMRRAQREFRRYFRQVQTFPVPEAQSPVDWQDFIPDANTLNTNRLLAHEWVGVIWYAITGA